MSGEVKSDRSMGVVNPVSFEQALWKNVWSHHTPMPNVLMGHAGPRRKVDSAKKNRTDAHIPFHLPRLEYEKRIKMLSLSPAVYGNIYGVLGTS